MSSTPHSPLREFGRHLQLAVANLFVACVVPFRKSHSMAGSSIGSDNPVEEPSPSPKASPNPASSTPKESHALPVATKVKEAQRPRSAPIQTAKGGLPHSPTPSPGKLRRLRRKHSSRAKSPPKASTTRSPSPPSAVPEGPKPLTGTLIDDRYEVKGFLDKGGFGEVYEGLDRRTNRKVAIKREFKGRHELKLENKIYAKLREAGLDKHFPVVHYFGKVLEYNVLVMEMLGRAADSLDDESDLTVPRIAKLACDVLDCLHALHSVGYVHCDLKPGNILTSASFAEKEVRDMGRYYLVDFGLATQFMSEDGEHLERQWLDTFMGTPEYTSLTVHDGYSQSRRDDIVSLGYVLLKLLEVDLAWDSEEVEDNWELIGLAKRGVRIGELCEGAPREMKDWFREAAKLGYKDEPDYDNFKNIANRMALGRSESDLDASFGSLFKSFD